MTRGRIRQGTLAQALVVALLTAGCAVKEEKPAEAKPEVVKPPEVVEPKPKAKKDGKYYKDDGPPDFDEVDWRAVPEPVPAFDPINIAYNKPYEVFGVRYLPFTDYTPYRKRGTASWYGKRYHGNKTSSGEVYDMYAMSAAHTVLPIPSYARVTRVDDGRSIIVRVNDRGPFLNERIIDLSYTAARKLGIVATGVGEVMVEALLPEEGTMLAKAESQPRTAQSDAGKEVEGSATEAAGTHFLQLGAFSSPDNAARFASSVNLPGGMTVNEVSVKEGGGLSRVLIGPYPSKFQAERDLDRLHDVGLEALLKIF